jgi:hypothetical protein
VLRSTPIDAGGHSDKVIVMTHESSGDASPRAKHDIAMASESESALSPPLSEAEQRAEVRESFGATGENLELVQGTLDSLPDFLASACAPKPPSVVRALISPHPPPHTHPHTHTLIPPQ